MLVVGWVAIGCVAAIGWVNTGGFHNGIGCVFVAVEGTFHIGTLDDCVLKL